MTLTSAMRRLASAHNEIKRLHAVVEDSPARYRVRLAHVRWRPSANAFRSLMKPASGSPARCLDITESLVCVTSFKRDNSASWACAETAITWSRAGAYPRLPSQLMPVFNPARKVKKATTYR